MEKIDINVLLLILEELSGKETLAFCSGNKKFKNMCNKYEDIIWKRKLLKDHGIEKDEIIGNPKSHYLGLERKQFWYYFFDITTSFPEDQPLEDQIPEDQIPEDQILSLERKIGYAKGTPYGRDIEYELVGREKINEEIFAVPGIDIPKGEKILLGYFQISSEHYGVDSMNYIGKNINKVRNGIFNLLIENFTLENNENIKEKILSLSPNTGFEEDLIIYIGYGGDIPYSCELSVWIFELTL